METFYLACNLGPDRGQVCLGSLNQGRLRVSELHSFPNPLSDTKSASQWDAPALHQEVLQGLSKAGALDLPICSVSCTSRGGEYLLFDDRGALVGTSMGTNAPRNLSKNQSCTDDLVFQETGTRASGDTTLFRLRGDKPRRLAKAARLLPVADGFNYLLSGEARVEASMASATQLFNPFEGAWSEAVLKSLSLSPALLPKVVPAGTLLGPLQPALSSATKLEEVKVVSSCSHEAAAMVAGLPVAPGQDWAYLNLDTAASMGLESPFPVADSTARHLGLSNAAVCDGKFLLSKPTVGLWLAEQCHRYYAEREDGFDWEVLLHLAASSAPFECIINPADPRFVAPGPMPVHIREYCKATEQPIPRKPGQVMRCVLESIALYHRKTLKDFEQQTGRTIERLYLVMEETRRTPLLNHFISNALQLPVVLVTPQSVATGNVMVQALANGHLKSFAEARHCIHESVSSDVILPHAQLWNAAFERLTRLV